MIGLHFALLDKVKLQAAELCGPDSFFLAIVLHKILFRICFQDISVHTAFTNQERVETAVAGSTGSWPLRPNFEDAFASFERYTREKQNSCN